MCVCVCVCVCVFVFVTMCVYVCVCVTVPWCGEHIMSAIPPGLNVHNNHATLHD